MTVYTCYIKNDKVEEFRCSSIDSLRQFFKERSTEIKGKLFVTISDNKESDYSKLFQNLKYVTEIDILIIYDYSNIVKISDMTSMFSGCENLETIKMPNVSREDVKYTIGIFNGCKKLKTVSCLKISSRDFNNLMKFI